MGWIILTTLAVLIVFRRSCTRSIRRPGSVRRRSRQKLTDGIRHRTNDYSLVGWAVAGVALVLWVFISGLMMVKNVGQREVAIVYSFSGEITGKRDTGTVMIAPWQHVKKENVGIQHEEWSFGEGNSAVSKDQQKVFGNLAVNYQIDAENVVDLYKRVGAGWKAIIVNARVPQVFKEVTATYQTQEITANREQLREQTRTRLAEELKPYDIDVVDVFVTNLGFSQGYTDAIEAKQKQVQDAQRQEAKIREAKAIAQQQVEAAKGERDANIARAQGDAQANKLRQRSLTKMLVQWEAIQKLNPNVSVIICPPNSVCVPNAGVIPNPGGGNG